MSTYTAEDIINVSQEEIVDKIGQQYAPLDDRSLRILLVHQLYILQFISKDVLMETLKRLTGSSTNTRSRTRSRSRSPTPTSTLTSTSTPTLTPTQLIQIDGEGQPKDPFIGFMEETKTFNLDDIAYILKLDCQERQSKSWKLYDLNQILYIAKLIKQSSSDDERIFNTSEMIYVSPSIPSWILEKTPPVVYLSDRYNDRQHLKSSDNPIKDLNEYCPELKQILLGSDNRLIAAGGSIMKALIHGLIGLKQSVGNDIDLFFVKCKDEDIDELVEQAYNTIVNGKYATAEQITLYRNQHATSIMYKKMDNIINLQFIHRIYPTKESVIGGFDIGASMVLYDGTNIYTTALGLFSVATNSSIVDITRASLNFEQRLIKYNKYGIGLIVVKDSNDYIFDNQDQLTRDYSVTIANFSEEDPEIPVYFISKGLMVYVYDVDEYIELRKRFLRLRLGYVKDKVKKQSKPTKAEVKEQSDYGGFGSDESLSITNLVNILNENYDYVLWEGETPADIFNPESILLPDKETLKIITRENIQERLNNALSIAKKGITIITDNPQRQYQSLEYELPGGKLWTASRYPVTVTPKTFYLQGTTNYLNLGECGLR